MTFQLIFTGPSVSIIYVVLNLGAVSLKSLTRESVIRYNGKFKSTTTIKKDNYYDDGFKIV